MSRDEMILTSAKAMHNHFEHKAQRAKHFFYSRTPWDRLDRESQDEFLQYAEVMTDALLQEQK